VNNLFDYDDVAGISAANATTASMQAYTPDPTDNLQLLPGRSIMLSFQVGITPARSRFLQPTEGCHR